MRDAQRFDTPRAMPRQPLMLLMLPLP